MPEIQDCLDQDAFYILSNLVCGYLRRHWTTERTPLVNFSLVILFSDVCVCVRYI